jgi:hypothetical protein
MAGILIQQGFSCFKQGLNNVISPDLGFNTPDMGSIFIPAG